MSLLCGKTLNLPPIQGDIANTPILNARYDAGAIKRYEGPNSGSEEVSLTLRTENKKLIKTSN